MPGEHPGTADAALWGVETQYLDYKDDVRRPPAESVSAALGAMEATGAGPPTPSIRIVHAGDAPNAGAAVEIVTEDGGAVDLRSGWPRDVPLGYHDLVGRDGARTPLIVAPKTCWLPEELRAWGWAVQLYSVHSRRSWGIGDLGDLADLGRWASGSGAGMLLLNPLHAAEPGKPQQPSPYFPSSRRWRNPLYLTVEDVPGAGGVDLEELARAGRALTASELVDRDAVLEAKTRALQRIWEEWPGSAEFEAFVAENGTALEEFATYVALHEEHNGGPATWSADLSHPGAPAVARWREQHRDRVRFHQWVQWLLDEQLAHAATSITLIHDLAVGVDPHGAEAWLWQDVFAQGVKVGAPPDEYNTLGQNWGLPPFDPWKLRAAGYEPFIHTLRAALAHGGGLRVDHVMGLFRLFWVPDGMEPRDGTYVRYPYGDLLDIVALESHRAQAFVVGEDLGTVEPIVREEMAARNMLSYKLMWFEDAPPERYPRLALAAVTNHDLPTVTGVWTGRDLGEQLALDLQPDSAAALRLKDKLASLPGVGEDCSSEDAVRGAYRALARAGSRVVAATLEDALGVELRPNLPGTLRERSNWSIRLPAALEDFDDHELLGEVAAIMSRRSAPDGTGAATAWRHEYADLDDVRIHYVEAGEGPLVVLLHGFPDFWYSWRKQIPALVDAGFRVVAPDMRGYNESGKPSGVGAYAVDRLVGDVRALIEHLDEERAHVAGHDWGGVVAWFLAMSAPDVVDRLAIVNAPHPRAYLRALGPKQALKSWYFLFFQLPWIPERAFAARDYAALRRVMRGPSTSPREVDEYVEAARRAGGLHYPINYYRDLFRAGPLRTLRSLRPVERPVLVVWGERDPFLEPSTADPGSDWAPVTVRGIPDGGHWVHVEEPGAVNAALTDFFGSATSSR